MDKLKFIVDGQVHRISADKKDLFLEKYPQAVPYEAESYADEDLTRANDLANKSNSFDETEEQKINNDRKADEMNQYVKPEDKLSLDEVEEIAENITVPTLPGAAGGASSWLMNTEIGRSFRGWLQRKVVETNKSEFLQDKGFEDDYQNVISLEEQEYLDVQKNNEFFEEAIADRDNVKVEELTEEQKQEAREANNKQYREDLANQGWWDNIEENIEDDNSWYNLTRSDEQLDKRDDALDVLNSVEDVTKRNMKRYTFHEKQLAEISDQLKVLAKKEPTTQEEYDQLKKTYERLQGEGEKHIASLKFIADQADKIGDSEDELRKYIDAHGRNYNEITNFAGNLAVAAGDMVANLEEAVHRYTDPGEIMLALSEQARIWQAEALDRDLADVQHPDVLKNFLSILEKRSDFREDIYDGTWGAISEGIRKGLEQPQQFGNIKDWESFGEWASQTTATQLPNTVVMLTTGPYALPILGLTSAGAKFKDIDREMEMYGTDENGNALYSPAQMYLTATITGAAEALSEKVTLGQLNKVKGAVKGLSEGTKQQIKSGFRNYLKRNFATRKGLGANIYDPIEEGFTESLSQVAGNLADKYVLGKEDVKILDGVTESFFSGLWMSGVVYKSPVLGANLMSGFRTTETKSSLFLNTKRVKEIGELLKDPKLSASLRLKYQKEQEDLVTENNKMILADVKRLDDLTEAEKTQLISLENQKQDLVQMANEINNDKSLSKEQKKTELDKLKNDYLKLDNGKNEILQPYVEVENAKKIDKQIGTIELEAQRIFKGDVSIQSFDDNKSLLEKLKEDNNNKPENQKQSLSELKKKSLQQGVIIQDPKTGKQTIYINRDASIKQGAVNVAAHEFLHAVLFESVKNNPETQKALGKNLQDYLMKIDASKVENSKFARRLKQYQDAVNRGDYSSANAAEEVLTLFSDAINTGDIKFNENILTKIGDVLRRVLQAAGVKVKFNNGRDVYNFIKDYNHGILKGKLGKGITTVARKGAEGTLVKEKKEAIEKTVEKESKAENLSDQVQSIYDKKGIDGAFEITELYRGMAGKLASKYRDVPGYTTYKDDFINELLTGKRGVYEMILKYNPDSGVPLAAYINKYIGSRAIEVADRIFEKEFTSDVTEARGVAEEVVEEVQETQQEQPSLRQQLNIEDGSPLYNKIKNAVLKAFGTKLPVVTSLQFKKELQKAYRVELKKAMADLIGTRAIKEQFLRDNFEAIYAKLSQEIINKRFRQFAEPVLDKDGKQMREKTPQGNAIFSKRKITKAEWLSYFLGKDVKPSTKGTRKDALAEALAEEIAFDATVEVIKDPKVQEKRKAIDEILEREQADNYVEETAKQINRDPNTKFSLSESDIDFDLNAEERKQVSQLNREVQKKNLEDLINEDGNMKDVSKYSNKVSKVVRYLHDIGLISDVKAYGFVAGIKKSGLFNYDSALKKTSALKDRQAFSKDMQTVGKELGGGIMSIIGLDGLGYINRVLDPAKQKLDGTQGDFYQDLNNLTKDLEGTDSTVPEGLILEDVMPMNSKVGIMKEIKDIQSMNISRSEKIKLFEETILPKLELANTANLLLAEHIVSKVISLYKANKISESSMLNFFQLQTNAVNGLRALTRLDLVRFEDGPQFGMPKQPNVTKTGKYKTEKTARNAYVNSWKQTPSWNTVFKVIKKGNPDATTQQIEDATINALSEKGEHLSPNSNTMLKLAEIGGKELTTAEVINQVSDVLAEHIQWLDINYNLDIVDLAGKTNQAKKGRLKALPKNKKADIYVVGGTNIDAYSNESQTTNEFRKKVADNTVEVTKLSIAEDAMDVARSKNNPDKGISVFDFDDTLAVTNSKIIVTMPNGKVMKINATEFAKRDAELTTKGATYDFSEFNKVIDGKKGPLFDLAMKRQDKFTSKDIFVLTARPQASAVAIHKFLKGIGLEIPLKNITGLEDGTAKAKADWILAKAAKGYNNFYFADDAYKNVKAVQDVLSQVDVKSDVQQAKFSLEDLDAEFNNIIEETEGVEAFKEYSQAAAQRIGSKKRSKWKFFLPPSAEDFVGLLYDFLAKGKKGEKQMEFFQKYLIKPFARGITSLNAAKQSMSNDWKGLKKAFPQVKKLLGKKTDYKDFTYDQAIRVYLWNKFGMPIPGLSKQDIAALVKIVKSNNDMVAFADTLSRITKLEEGYIAPSEYWLAGTTASDLNDVTEKIGRKQFLKEFIENIEVIFSPKNLNKIEAIYGSNFREALEDMIYRMKNGTNRSFGKNRIVNRWMNWVNNSVGAIMFLNMRSAILQTISAANFVNWSDNNMLKAGLAFANQKQFWSDFTMIFNSDMLKQRRSGLQTDVNEAEIANAAANSKNKAQAILAYLLKIGFTPTQIADSFAIAFGGASMYRNRVKTYLKQGLSKVEAEKKAFQDFSDITEENQQSSRPDRISQQQAGPLGRVILAFQNTPMQYMRLTKKAMRDLVNGRGDFKTNVSKIIYYGAVQNFVFATLQNALFGMLFASEEEEEDLRLDKKKSRIVNGMMDTVLRGSGLYGAVVSTVKNTIMKFIEQEQKGWTADHTYTIIEAVNLSPPIGSKLRKLYSAIQTYKFNKDVMKKMGMDIDNPAYDAFGNVVSGVTNLPLDRAIRKVRNVRASLDERNAAWQRIATLLGWTTWDVGVENYEVEEVKKEVKREKKFKNKFDNKKSDKFEKRNKKFE